MPVPLRFAPAGEGRTTLLTVLWTTVISMILFSAYTGHRAWQTNQYVAGAVKDGLIIGWMLGFNLGMGVAGARALLRRAIRWYGRRSDA